MNNIDILLTVVVGYIVYLLVLKKKPCNKNNTNNTSSNSGSKRTEHYGPITYDDAYLDDLVKDLQSWDGSSYDKVVKKLVKPNFLDTQFHNDYREVLTALNNLVPSQKQLFNLPNQPVNYYETDPNEVDVMVKDFINTLNKNILDEVPGYRNKNSGWDESIPDPRMQHGWEKFMEGLGLAPSIYQKPAEASEIYLVTIDKVQKYETEDEIKYVCHLILGKKNVCDQMLMRASLVQDKRALHDENNFFKSREIEMRVALEELFVVGYLSDYGLDATKQYVMNRDKFYNIDEMEHNNLTDPKDVLKELTRRHRRNEREMNYRNTMFDEEGRDFHHNMPHPYDYSSYQVTRTIYDDMTKPKYFV